MKAWICMLAMTAAGLGVAVKPSPEKDPKSPAPPIRCGVRPTGIRPHLAPAERRPVDLVICLDTSGSMTALIDSARAKLWEVVNELARAKPLPRLRVGLLTYGSPNLASGENGFIVKQTDLTGDLDTVYQKMMAMATNGGDEYVGWVLHDALSSMNWSRDPKAMRIIFVAGNESADQAAARYNFRHVLTNIDAGIGGVVVNAIYAGDKNQGVTERWQEVAQYGGGCYLAIDMREGTLQVATPHDQELELLNKQLNATYLSYGAEGRKGKVNQAAQDKNAAGLGEQSCASRIVAKATELYDNAGWDLVDASKKEDFKLGELDGDALPEVMKPMSPEERNEHLKQVTANRGRIQERIKGVAAKRGDFLKVEREKRASSKTSLDEAMRSAIRQQARDKGFSFDDDAGPTPASSDGAKADPGREESDQSSDSK